MEGSTDLLNWMGTGLLPLWIAIAEGAALPSGESVIVVDASYTVADWDAAYPPVHYRQSNGPISNPGASIATRLEIDGIDVWKAVNDPANRPGQAVYWWESNGVARPVTAELADGITEDLIEALVGLIVAAEYPT